MRHLQAVILAALALSGCKSQQERLQLEAQNDAAACEALGYRRGTPDFLQCMRLQIDHRNADDAQRAESSRQLSETLGGISQSIKPVYGSKSTATTTNCRPDFGGGFNCSTY
jgi:hypothetical protein